MPLWHHLHVQWRKRSSLCSLGGIICSRTCFTRGNPQGATTPFFRGVPFCLFFPTLWHHFALTGIYLDTLCHFILLSRPVNDFIHRFLIFYLRLDLVRRCCKYERLFPFPARETYGQLQLLAKIWPIDLPKLWWNVNGLLWSFRLGSFHGAIELRLLQGYECSIQRTVGVFFLFMPAGIFTKIFIIYS